MLMLDHMRNEVGLPCGSIANGRHIAWTTDNDKAEAAREAGANVLTVRSAMIGGVPHGDDPNRIIGHEVSFAVGREMDNEFAVA